MRIILLLPLLLAACGDGGVKEAVGLARTAPDEFTVVSRPALSVPPDFSLRPPRPGEPPRAPSADATARGLLIGKEATPQDTIETLREPKNPTAVSPVLTEEAPSGATSQILKRAGAEKAHENIRGTLREDAATPADTSGAKSLLEKVTGDANEEPVVDAKKEAERLRSNKDVGKPVTEGDVQVEKPKPPSVWDRIF